MDIICVDMTVFAAILSEQIVGVAPRCSDEPGTTIRNIKDSRDDSAIRESARRHFCVPPTRLEKPDATATAPSAIFKPSDGKGRGAGPSTTAAPFFGS